MIDQEESPGSKVWNCDLTRSKIIKSLYIQTKGQDHGDETHSSDEENLRNLALSSKLAFHDAIKYLWEDVTLHQVNTLYRQETETERIKIYLSSVRSLTVPSGSVTSTQLRSSLLVEGYQQNRHIFLRYDDEASAPYMWSLEGVRLLHNLESIWVRCCPYGFSRAWLDDGDNPISAKEIHQIDGRGITVHTFLRDIDGWLWDEPAIRLGDGPSVLDTLLIRAHRHPARNNPRIRSLMRQIHAGGEGARARLQAVRSLSLSGRGVSIKQLGVILELFPALESFNSEIYNPGIIDGESSEGASLCEWLSHSEHTLIEASLRRYGVADERPTLDTGHGDEDGMKFGADLRWLPYFRRCKKLRLPCHIRWVAELGSKMVFTEIEIPSVNNLEDLTLEIMDQRAVTPHQVKRVIEFIQQNTTERTGVTIRFVYCGDGRPYPVHHVDPSDWEQAWEMMANFAKHCEKQRTRLRS